jgi:hypothetical protein
MTPEAFVLPLILGITLPTAAHMYIRARKQPLSKKGLILLCTIFLLTHFCVTAALRQLPEGENLSLFYNYTVIAISIIMATKD